MLLYKTKESKVVRVDEDSNDEEKVSNQTVSFTEADTRFNIQSGETFSTILGKIKKFFTDLTTVAFTGNYNDLSNRPAIPEAVAVKGNAESTYRTGNVNITPDNIGLGNVDNTADEDKSVLKAVKDGDGNKISETYATKNEVDSLKKSVSDGKTIVANAITGKGVTTATDAAFQTMAANISKISTGADVSGVTAGANDVVKGKTIVNNSSIPVNGAIPDRSHVAGGASGVVGLEAGTYSGVAVSPYETAYHWRINTDGVKRFCIRPPWGVYGGTSGTRGGDGYVGCPVSMFGNATQSHVLSGAKFTSQNGLAIDGTMTNRGAVSKTLGINGSYTIPAGYHNGSGKVTQSITTKAAATYTPTTSNQTISSGQYLSGAQTIKGDANLIPANIKSGVSIFGVTGNYKGISGEDKINDMLSAYGSRNYVYPTYSSNYTSASTSTFGTGGNSYRFNILGTTYTTWSIRFYQNSTGEVGNIGFISGAIDTTVLNQYTLIVYDLSNNEPYFFSLNGNIRVKLKGGADFFMKLTATTGSSSKYTIAITNHNKNFANITLFLVRHTASS